MVHQAVQDRCRRQFAAEQLVPSAHRQVGRYNEGVLFIAVADHLEEKALSFPVHLYIGQFINDQKMDLVQLRQHCAERPLLHLFIQPVDEVFCVYKEDLISGIDSIHTDPCSDHALTDSRRADDNDVLIRFQESKAPKFLDLVPVQRMVEAVVGNCQDSCQ